MTPLEKIEDRGLSVITWHMEKAAFDGRDVTQYAVSIDGIGPDQEPSEEQKRFCNWADTPKRAAELYIRRNPDHFS